MPGNAHRRASPGQRVARARNARVLAVAERAVRPARRAAAESGSGTAPRPRASGVPGRRADRTSRPAGARRPRRAAGAGRRTTGLSEEAARGRGARRPQGQDDRVGRRCFLRSARIDRCSRRVESGREARGPSLRPVRRQPVHDTRRLGLRPQPVQHDARGRGRSTARALAQRNVPRANVVRSRVGPHRSPLLPLDRVAVEARLERSELQHSPVAHC